MKSPSYQFEKMSVITNFSLKALQTKINACWFEGYATIEQQRCITGFTIVYLFYKRILGVDIPLGWISYVLATIYHETARTMKPIAEYGKGAGKPYGVPDPVTGNTYYGRGYVQLTWKENYGRAEKVVKSLTTLEQVPFVSYPDLAMDPIYAAQIAINGMVYGWFTGKKLSDFITPEVTDYVSARKIINGTDKAELIASYAEEAEIAINLAEGHPVLRNVLSIGSKGDDVRELQLILGELPDGHFGTNTQSKLISFQKLNSISQDGICGQETWRVINENVYLIDNGRLLVR